jgi:hypothetical protein
MVCSTLLDLTFVNLNSPYRTFWTRLHTTTRLMAFIDLGKLKFNWQGDWSASTDYEVDDVVFYDNHSFVCRVTLTATDSAPSANLTQWDLMACWCPLQGRWRRGLVQVLIIARTLFVTTQTYIF